MILPPSPWVWQYFTTHKHLLWQRVVFFSNREIRKGEELTFDYKLKTDGNPTIPCYCGARSCNGFMEQSESTDERTGCSE